MNLCYTAGGWGHHLIPLWRKTNSGEAKDLIKKVLITGPLADKTKNYYIAPPGLQCRG
jgi:hypothetical protein